MPAPTVPLVGMAPAIQWTAGDKTFQVIDPRFYDWLSSATGNRQIWAYDFPRDQTAWNSDRTEAVFSLFTVPPRVIAPGAPLKIDAPVYLYVADTANPQLLRQDKLSPQQEGFVTYDFSGRVYAGLVLYPDGTVAPHWDYVQDHFVTVDEFLTAAVLVWGGAFAVGAVAGAGTASVGAAGTAAGTATTDYAGATAVGAATTPAVPLSSGATVAGAGTSSFSLANVVAGAKTATQAAGVVSAIEKAINQPGSTPVNNSPPEDTPPDSQDNSWLIGLVIVGGLILLQP